MRVKTTFRDFDDTDCDIRAVIGDTLKIVQQVRENKTELNRTGTLLKPFDMSYFDLVGKAVDHLLERLYRCRQSNIRGFIRADRCAQYFGERAYKEVDLAERRRGESNVLDVQLPRCSEMMDGLIADAVLVGAVMLELRDVAGVLLGEVMACNTNEERTHMILVTVEKRFVVRDALCGGLVIVLENIERF